MAMTMSAAIGELSALRGEVSVGEVAGKAASALLRGARGNSGVILSLIYRGIAKSLKGKDEICLLYTSRTGWPGGRNAAVFFSSGDLPAGGG